MALMTKEELTALIEQAFADTVYPGDDKLTRENRPEYIRITYKFRGKHWTTVSDVEHVTYEQFALSYFEPEAFRFYLPAFMLAALNHQSEVCNDLVPENIESSLTPPETNSAEAEDWFATFGITRMDYFLKRVSGFSPQQKAAIKAYLQSSFEQDSIPEWIERQQERQRALHFWSTFEG